jgi:peptidoglycan/xylan/chitin deacetylase (PgdA/CDA1 family)
MRGTEPTARHQLYVDLWRRLQPLTAAARARALDALAAQVGGHGEPRRDYLPCTADELRALAGSDVGTVGAHTVSHPELAHLPTGEQASEIRDSRAALEALLGRPVTLFSYPFGHPHSFTSQTRRLVREAGYQAACANWTGLVAEGADPLRLPRVYVGDLEGAVLCRQLDQLFGEA